MKKRFMALFVASAMVMSMFSLVFALDEGVASDTTGASPGDSKTPGTSLGDSKTPGTSLGDSKTPGDSNKPNPDNTPRKILVAIAVVTPPNDCSKSFIEGDKSFKTDGIKVMAYYRNYIGDKFDKDSQEDVTAKATIGQPEANVGVNSVPVTYAEGGNTFKAYYYVNYIKNVVIKEISAATLTLGDSLNRVSASVVKIADGAIKADVKEIRIGQNVKQITAQSFADRTDKITIKAYPNSEAAKVAQSLKASAPDKFDFQELPVIPGIVTGGEELGMVDALASFKAIVNNEVDRLFCSAAADFDGNDSVNLVDVLGILLRLKNPEPTNVPVTGVALNKTTTSIAVGATETLTAAVAPDNATNKNVTWSTSDATIATVANGVITGVAAGNATITATTEDGSQTATCTVTVTAAGSGENVPVTAVTITQGSTYTLVTNPIEGGTYKSEVTLTATVTPDDATNSTVTWSVEDGKTDVVTLEEATGKVTAVGAGTAVITATADGKTATCTITVDTRMVETDLANPTTESGKFEINNGNTGTLTLTGKETYALASKFTANEGKTVKVELSTESDNITLSADKQSVTGAKATPEGDTATTVTVTIKAGDNEVNAGEVLKTYTITVTVNEVVFSQDNADNITLKAYANNAEKTTLTAGGTEADSCTIRIEYGAITTDMSSADVTYTITSGNDENAVTLDENSGLVTATTGIINSTATVTITAAIKLTVNDVEVTVSKDIIITVKPNAI